MEEVLWHILKTLIFMYLISFAISYIIDVYSIGKCKNGEKHKLINTRLERYDGLGGSSIIMSCKHCHKEFITPRYSEIVFRKVLLILITLTTLLDGAVILLQWLQIL